MAIMEFSVWVIMLTLLVIGLATGFLMHRSDFCLAGAFRDVFLFNSYRSLRQLVLLVITAAFLFELSRLAGVLPFYPFPWFAPPAMVNILGGLVFGLGMVLSGGCVIGILYKMGGGSLMAGVAFLGLLVGSALYAEVHPWWAAVARQSQLFTTSITLPQLIGMSPFFPLLAAVVAGGFCCWRWWQAGLLSHQHVAEGFIAKWITAISLAVLSLLTVLVSGMPIGVTTSYAKLSALLESRLLPEHFTNLSYFSSTTVRYALPIDGILRSGGAGPQFDIVAIVQGPLILGIFGGAWLSARLLGEFRIVWRLPLNQLLMVFSGGVIMALGARMSPGCNVWHLFGGLPLLTMQSLLFVCGLVPGAWLGSKAVQWILTSEAKKKERSYECA